MKILRLNDINNDAVECMFPNMGILHDYRVDKIGVTITTKVRIPSDVIKLPSLPEFNKDIKLVTWNERTTIRHSITVPWQPDMPRNIAYHSTIQLKRLQQAARKYKIELMKHQISLLDDEVDSMIADVNWQPLLK